MKPKRLLALGVLLAGVTAAASLRAAQKPAPPQPSEQQKLKERVDALESQLKEAQAKADRAAMEKDYILRTQNHYESYYKEVFSTQTHILWTIGITVTLLSVTLSVVFFVAGRFGFNIFDRRIDSALKDATAQLERNFDEKLAAELKKLTDSNAAETQRLKEATEEMASELAHELRIRSDYTFHFSQALTMGTADRLPAARVHYRLALKAYKEGKPGNIIAKDSAATVLKNIFKTIKREDGTTYVDNARKELAKKLYDDLDDELAQAALEIDWLRPLLIEKQQGASAAPEPPKAAPAHTPAQKPPALAEESPTPAPANEKAQPAKPKGETEKK